MTRTRRLRNNRYSRRVIDLYRSSDHHDSNLSTAYSCIGASSPRYRKMNPESKIVVDGTRRRLNGHNAKKRRKELNKNLLSELGDEFNRESLLKRLVTRIRIRRAVNRIIRKEFDHGLHHLNLKPKL